MLSQSQSFDQENHPNDGKYVENIMWEEARVLYVTVNIPGGSNNDSDAWYGAPSESQQQQDEREERTGADLRWLDAAFARAGSDGVIAVVIQTQADMWDLDGKAPSHLAQYKPFIDSIASHKCDIRQAGDTLQWRLAHLPLGQPAREGRALRYRVFVRRLGSGMRR